MSIVAKQEPQAQNAHIRALLFTAADALEVLFRDGFKVQRVELDDNKPLIWVQASPRCRNLRGAWFRRLNGANGVELTWQASLSGCRVRWRTRGDEFRPARSVLA